MQGNPEVIAGLNSLLAHETTSADLYRVFAAMLDDQGLVRLRDRFAHEATDEQGHVKALTDRILFLEGTPDVMSRKAVPVPRGAAEILQGSLDYEVENAAMLNGLIALCREAGDNGTRAILEPLLADTEGDHIFWLQSQLTLIEQVGLANYLAVQIG